MEAPSNTGTTVSLKLLVDTKKNKVLFAEVSKEVVDFLFSIMSLHLGTIIRLVLSTTALSGCLGKLYQSIENLSDAYLNPSHKAALLTPESHHVAGPNILCLPTNINNDSSQALKSYECVNSSIHKAAFLTPESHYVARPPCLPTNTQAKLFYKHGNCSITTNTSKRNVCKKGTKKSGTSNMWPKNQYESGMCTGNQYVSDNISPEYGDDLSSLMTYVALPPDTVSGGETLSGGEGHVKGGVVKYIVMDDLEVKPMSNISSITVLRKFNMKDVGALEEMVVDLGFQEGLKLLNAAMELSTSVLTNVFLGKIQLE